MKAEVGRRLAAALVAAAISVAGAGTAAGQPAVAVIAPLERFAGTWFQLAAFGEWGQAGCAADTMLRIAPRAADDADVQSGCRKATGVAVRNGRLRAPGGEGAWRTRFGPPIFSWLRMVWSDFWVLGHDAGLSWFLAGGHEQQRLAIYARTITIDESAMAQALAVARRSGFDVSRLQRTLQDPNAWREAR